MGWEDASSDPLEDIRGVADSQSRGWRLAHACNCIGCCRECGMCRTSPNHTKAMCMLLQKQAEEREALVKNEERWQHRVSAEGS